MIDLNLKIGIVGLGFVGQPIKKWFEMTKKYHYKDMEIFYYDSNPKKKAKDDLRKAEIIFICVPTQSRKDGSCDTSIVESVVSPFQNSKKLLVIKSTVSVGVTEYLDDKYNVSIIFNPEFLTEKNAWLDFFHPDRQVIGYTERSKKYVDSLFDILPKPVGGNCLKMKAKAAELTKYFCNSFGFMKVDFANGVYDLSRAFGVDYEDIKKGIGSDSRIGHSWLNVFHGGYRGAGGFCFPKDMMGLIHSSYKKSIEISEKDPQLGSSITAFVKLLELVYYYNESLIKSQGLTMEDISGHINSVKLKNKIKD